VWAFWLAFGVIAAALLLAMVRVERRRLARHVEAGEATARKLGATYSYRAPDELLRGLEGFDLTFADGARLPRSVRDVLTFKADQLSEQVFLHEHRGTLPAGTGAAGAMTHRETVAYVTSPSWALPRFRLSPERPLERLVSVLGLRDIDFASHPGFSGSYYLNSDNEGVRRLFGSNALDYFESHPGWHVEGRGNALLIYRFGKAAALEELPEFLRAAREISGLFQP
jgi:hypothetical protein